MNCTMKKYKLIAVFLLLGCLCSCTKFLDLPAKNERAVQSLDDIKSVLAGYLYGQANPRQTSTVGLSPLFTSEMAVDMLNSSVKEAYSLITLFGLSAEEMLEAGASYEAVKGMENLLL